MVQKINHELTWVKKKSRKTWIIKGLEVSFNDMFEHKQI